MTLIPQPPETPAGADAWDARYAQEGWIFGTEPNAFLRQVAARLPFGRALCLGEGEGRNAVFLAARGLAVTAVDASAVGLAKASRLAASRQLRITPVVADLADYVVAPAQWDVIVLVFVHLPAALRARVHAQAVQGLRPGGALVLEGFAPAPGETDATGHLMPLAQLRSALASLDFAHAQACGRVLDEGACHQGQRHVVQILAYRRAPQAHAPEHARQLCVLATDALARAPRKALRLLSAAISWQPQDADLHYRRAVALRQLQHLPQALTAYDDTLALCPQHPQALANRANVLHELLQLDAALAAYNAALAVRPQAAHVRLNQALCLLRMGDLRQGWPAFEARHQVDGYQRSHYHGRAPRWQGQGNLQGLRVLLHAEQGLGDSVQMLRYVAPLKARGARVLLHLPSALTALVHALPGVDGCTAFGQSVPAHDLQCPLLSLPLAFQTTLDTIPGADGYLAVDAARRAHWEHRLGARQGLRVGLVASGDPRHLRDAQRSLPWAALLPTLAPGLQVVCLQRELRPADAALLGQHPHVRFFGPQLRDLADTAALCSLMDVVVSVDTAVAHLSAALGKPTWILLAQVADWRWLQGRDDSPWYRHARLLRQQRAGQWRAVLELVAHDLHALAQQQPDEPARQWKSRLRVGSVPSNAL